jgi:hypothetical protein
LTSPLFEHAIQPTSTLKEINRLIQIYKHYVSENGFELFKSVWKPERNRFTIWDYIEKLWENTNQDSTEESCIKAELLLEFFMDSMLIESIPDKHFLAICGITKYIASIDVPLGLVMKYARKDNLKAMGTWVNLVF